MFRGGCRGALRGRASQLQLATVSWSRHNKINGKRKGVENEHSRLIRTKYDHLNPSTSKSSSSITIERNVSEFHTMLKSIRKVHHCYALLKQKERIVNVIVVVGSVAHYRNQTHLLDVDLPRLWRRSLRHHNAQDTVLQASLDSILIDTGREGEAAVERSHRALANPVLVLGLMLRNLLLLRLLGYLSVFVRGLSRLVFDRGLVLLVLGGLKLLLIAVAFNSSRALTFFADVLVLARDLKGVVVGPLDVDILLVNARELTVEFVSLLCLLDVKLWCEGADALELAVNIAEGLTVVLVEEAEDGSELLSEAWEERHCC